MEHVIAVVVLIALAGVFAYLKIPAVKAKVDGILRKPAVENTKPNVAVITNPAVLANPFEEFRGLSYLDVVRIGQQRKQNWNFSPEEIQQLKDAGVIFRDVQEVLGPPIDRTGFHVTYENSPRVNEQKSGESRTYTFGRAGKVRVFGGTSGTQLREVNGQEVDELWFQHDGSPLAVVVRGVGPNGPPMVSVQLQ